MLHHYYNLDGDMANGGTAILVYCNFSASDSTQTLLKLTSVRFHLLTLSCIFPNIYLPPAGPASPDELSGVISVISTIYSYGRFRRTR
jgi:hypothetical protein